MIGNYSSERSVHVGTLSEAAVRSALKLTYLWHNLHSNASTLEKLKVRFTGLSLYFPAR